MEAVMVEGKGAVVLVVAMVVVMEAEAPGVATVALVVAMEAVAPEVAMEMVTGAAREVGATEAVLEAVALEVVMAAVMEAGAAEVEREKEQQMEVETGVVALEVAKEVAALEVATERKKMELRKQLGRWLCLRCLEESTGEDFHPRICRNAFSRHQQLSFFLHSTLPEQKHAATALIRSKLTIG